MFKEQVRFAEPLLDIAAGPGGLVADIAVGVDQPCGTLVGGGAVMDERRPRLHRLHRVEDGR